jgi:exosortase/archaeosortase family protein
LLAGDAFLRSGWAKLVLVLAVLPVAILKNGIRIVTLSLLATHVDEEFLTGQLHHEGGVVFFVVSLAILAPVVAVLRRSELRPVAAS